MSSVRILFQDLIKRAHNENLGDPVHRTSDTTLPQFGTPSRPFAPPSRALRTKMLGILTIAHLTLPFRLGEGPGLGPDGADFRALSGYFRMPFRHFLRPCGTLKQLFPLVL